MTPAILTDLTMCIGCEACMMACKEVNGLPDEPSDELSATTWTIVERREGLNIRRHCMHCLDPACVSVCPVGALQKTDVGPVIYEEQRCIGCRYCMVACPFGIPKYEWDDPTPRVQKCIMCFRRRVSRGLAPACTSACPTGATLFGDRDELIHTAERRIAEAPERYIDRVYGRGEAGGTSVLYLSSVPFEELGFRSVLQGSPYPRLTWQVLSKIPNVVATGGVLLCGIWWLTKRRATLESVEAGRMTIEEAMEQMPPLVDTGRKQTSQKSR